MNISEVKKLIVQEESDLIGGIKDLSCTTAVKIGEADTGGVVGTHLDGFTAKSIIGAINESKGLINNSYTDSFLISDWVNASNIYYTLTFTHNLNMLIPQVELYEGNYSVRVDKVELIDANSVKIYVPFSPDGRFNGSVIIIK